MEITYSEDQIRKVQFMIERMPERQLDQIVKTIRRRRPKVDNINCFLFKLPAELRNIIYEYIAEDAHASCAKVVKVNYISSSFREARERNKNAAALCDAKGKKVRLGIMGTCRELYHEFHPIFYSSKFINAMYWRPKLGWKRLESPSLLDAVINEKHSAWRQSSFKSRELLEALVIRDDDDPTHALKTHGMLFPATDEIERQGVEWRVSRWSPWCLTAEEPASRWRLAGSCMDVQVLGYLKHRRQTCSLCGCEGRTVNTVARE